MKRNLTAITALIALFATLVFVSGCGVKKEVLPERPASELPDIPLKEKPMAEPGTLVFKKEELQISQNPEELKINSMVVANGAEKFPRVQKQFRLPIQFDGWIMVTQLIHSFQQCSGSVAEPKVFLIDDQNGKVEMAVDQKVHVIHEKLYLVRVVFENEAVCSGLDIRFGVLFGE